MLLVLFLLMMEGRRLFPSGRLPLRAMVTSTLTPMVENFRSVNVAITVFLVQIIQPLLSQLLGITILLMLQFTLKMIRAHSAFSSTGLKEDHPKVTVQLS